VAMIGVLNRSFIWDKNRKINPSDEMAYSTRGNGKNDPNMLEL
jgi:hypothetical protein